jgi:hypothetical protein
VALPVSVAAALTINSITERLGLWQSAFESTSFTIQSFRLNPRGANRVEVPLTLKNTGSATHSAEVTVQLLDAGGNLVAEQTQSTGSVASDGTWSYTFIFTGTGITSSVKSVMIIVRQTN